MNQLDAIDLFTKGTLCFADMEEAGIALDVPYLKKQQKDIVRQIKDLKGQLVDTEEGRVGLSLFGRQWECTNNNQLAKVLVKCGHTLPKTAKGNDRTDKEVMAAVSGPFAAVVSRIRSLEKINGTYITQWLREVGPDGYMHPSFNLHTVRTYRSSSSNPNFQNVPRRDKVAQGILRRAIIPSKGNRLLEVDYGAMEVRIISCYTGDPVLVDYITSGKDMHQDCASWVFDTPLAITTKEMRDIIKNQFVFPEFYGSWFESCARNIWATLVRTGMKDGAGNVLKKKWGTLEAFTAHVKKVEEKQFWKRFSATRSWQEEWYDTYKRTGAFKMLTGFECSGVMSRNDLFNWPVQGSAFHCLLWSLIEINGIMKKRGMQSRLIGQIHDSGVFDVVPEEFDELVVLINSVMTKRIRKQWPWLIVPLLVEAEASPIDGSWFDKATVELNAA